MVLDRNGIIPLKQWGKLHIMPKEAKMTNFFKTMLTAAATLMFAFATLTLAPAQANAETIHGEMGPTGKVFQAGDLMIYGVSKAVADESAKDMNLRGRIIDGSTATVLPDGDDFKVVLGDVQTSIDTGPTATVFQAGDLAIFGVSETDALETAKAINERGRIADNSTAVVVPDGKAGDFKVVMS